MKRQYIALLAISLAALPALAENAKPAVHAAPSITSAVTTNAEPDIDTVSYAIGMNFAEALKKNLTNANVDTVIKAMKDIYSGGQTRITVEEARKTLRAFQMAQRTKMIERNKIVGEKNKIAAEEFLAKNSKVDGVKTLPSGLQYQVITEGAGASPKSNDVVTVNYKGMLMNDTEFDSSYKRGKPFETTLAPHRIIRGWYDALQLMKPGAKWKIFIPPALAYGERGMPPMIEPNSLLIFEVELVSFKAGEKAPGKAPAGSVQTVSGEILKVPSADEMKKGAKIEVMKPGETNKIEVK